MGLVKSSFALLLMVFVMGCHAAVPGMAGSTPPDHSVWDQLLKAHVNKDGTVNYKGFIADKAKLEAYLKTLSEHAPDRGTWSKQEQLAYWINAYNAFTVKLVSDNYPTKSIRDLGPKFKIPGLKTVWHYKFFQIGGKDSSLDEIEHGILRKEFDEPRIHFAINCASVSCPPLLNEAYTAEKLEAQLDRVARGFLADKSRNKITADKAEISSIFSWFKGDFTKEDSLVDFLNRYSPVKIKPTAKISYLDYNWELND